MIPQILKNLWKIYSFHIIYMTFGYRFQCLTNMATSDAGEEAEVTDVFSLQLPLFLVFLPYTQLGTWEAGRLLNTNFTTSILFVHLICKTYCILNRLITLFHSQLTILVLLNNQISNTWTAGGYMDLRIECESGQPSYIGYIFKPGKFPSAWWAVKFYLSSQFFCFHSLDQVSKKPIKKRLTIIRIILSYKLIKKPKIKNSKL